MSAIQSREKMTGRDNRVSMTSPVSTTGTGGGTVGCAGRYRGNGGGRRHHGAPRADRGCVGGDAGLSGCGGAWPYGACPCR